MHRNLDTALTGAYFFDMAAVRAVAEGALGYRAYRSGAPWPHVVVDDAVEPSELRELAAEASAVPDELLSWERSRRIRKGVLADTERMGPALRGFFAACMDAPFMGTVEELTGVTGLVADPGLTYAGLYVTPPGGWQRVHEDFPVHPETGLWNRVAVLVYLSDWAAGDGGELELWPEDMVGSPTLVEPRPGRMVVFETSAATRHGIRQVAPGAPPRLALGVRYYSATPPTSEPRPVHRRTVRRPGERLRDVRPSVAEIARYATGKGSRGRGPWRGAPTRATGG